MEVFTNMQFDNFMPHGHCYMWMPEILWLHVVSDAIVVISYYGLPLVLGYIAFKTKIHERYKSIFLLFSIFILACGTTHLVEIINVWNAKYVLAGILKALTAVVSFITLIVSIKLAPEIIKILDPETKSDIF